MKIVLFLMISLWGGKALAATLDTVTTVRESQDSTQTDSTDLFMLATPPQKLIEDPELSEPVRYNPLASMGISMFFPGAGQIYCKRPVRGCLFFGVDLIFALVTKNRMDYYRYTLKDNMDDYTSLIGLHLDSMSKYISNLELYENYYNKFIDAQMGYDLARYRRRAGRYVTYQALGWTIGIYLWNILDALGCSNAFSTNKPKNPAAASLLSAIPFFGLGQMYNGSFNKAGLIWTTHTMLAYMSYNYNRLMNDCINKRHQVESSQTVSDEEVRRKYMDRWDEEYTNAFRKRNTYLWYFVLFYFYGVFDAAVDAHLHDYKLKMRLEPNLETENESVSLSISVDF